MNQPLRRALLGLALTFGLHRAAQAQTGGVGIGTAAPNASALLDLSSTTKGLLAPRLTAAQRAAIASPAQGLLVFQTDGLQPGFWYHTGTAWTYVNPSPAGDNLGNHTATQNLNLGTNQLVGNGGSSGLAISSGGSVGIGTTSPRGKLDVVGGDTYLVSDPNIGSSQSVYLPGHLFLAPYSGISGTAYLQARTPIAVSNASIGLTFRTTGNGNTIDAMHLGGNGNVGIGTITPGQKLEVAGQIYSSAGGFRFPDGTVQATAAGTATAPALTLSGQTLGIAGGNTVTLPVGADNLGNHTATQNLNLADKLLVGNGGSSGLGISSAGNVGIGTGSPVAPLEVQRNDASAYALFHDPNDAFFSFGQDRGAANSIKISDGNGFGGVNYLTIQRSTGNVGIGTTDPQASALLDVATTTKGFLPPRLSLAQRDAISSPAAGLIIYNTTSNKLNTYNGATWTADLSTTEIGTSEVRFPFTGGVQTWTVPPGVTSIRVDAAGAKGENSLVLGRVAQGGQGGRVQATLAVTPGQVLSIYVGGTNGYNGGGAGSDQGGAYSGGGGGGTDLRAGGTALTDRLLVAGGGGGAGTERSPPAPGGCGGGLVGCAGSTGGGGTQSAGGDSGPFPTNQASGLGQGASRVGSGSGGGGYYGGGSGFGTYQSGGGGSSYTSPTLASGVQHTQGYNAGNGYLAIGFGEAAPALSLANATLPGAGAGAVVYSNGTSLTGNSAQFFWDAAAGRLGIGTSSPQARLHVAGTARLDGLAGSGTRMVTTDNNGTFGSQPLPTESQTLSISGNTISLTNGGSVTVPAPQLSKSGSTISLTNGGSVTDSDNQALSISGSTISLTGSTATVTVPSSADNLGNHTATQNLNLNGNLLSGGGSLGLRLDANGNASFGSSTRQMLNLWSTSFGLGVQSNTQYFRSAESFAWFSGGTHNDAQFNAGGGTTQMVLKEGKLGIGITNPAGALDVPTGSVHLPNDSWINYFGDNKNYLRGTTILADDAQGGRVGIGTANPSFPLDVQSTVTPGNYAYAFYAASNGAVYTGSTGGNTGPVSIRATGRILASEFNATSDRRLKTVIGLSDNATDLGLLNRLRITDYTMRDRVQYGSRRFKKVIAQEVEAVFPQAVNQHAGFLPDVYVNAVKAEAQADSLLVLTLPAVAAAHAGQRLKLIGAAGEVVATVKAASGATLTVRGARQLAGQKVFVFGLEHDDVRTVDYEALAMLNVSATQELARLLAELQKQNAALKADATSSRADLQKVKAEASTQTAELQKFKAEASTQTADLAQRLQALENMLGAKASVK